MPCGPGRSTVQLLYHPSKIIRVRATYCTNAALNSYKAGTDQLISFAAKSGNLSGIQNSEGGKHMKTLGREYTLLRLGNSCRLVHEDL